MSRVLIASLVLALVSVCVPAARLPAPAHDHCAFPRIDIDDFIANSGNSGFELLCPFTLDSTGSMVLADRIPEGTTCLPLYGYRLDGTRFNVSFIPV